MINVENGKVTNKYYASGKVREIEVKLLFILPLNMEKFVFVKKLGEGSYGSVCRAINKETRETVAIKTLKTKYSSSQECLNLPEVKCLFKLGRDHPNIVLLKQLFYILESQTLHMVFESMDCTLFYLIQVGVNLKLPFSESEIRNYALQLLQGLAHMHKKGYMHRDIKPDNLLMTPETIKIADFGLAREEVWAGGPSYNYSEYVCARWYRAPELILGCGEYTSAIDIWSMGAVLAEMFNLEPLFPGENTGDQMYKICSVIGNPNRITWLKGVLLAKEIKYEFPQTMNGVCMSSHNIPTASEEAVNLIRWMCSWDPDMRPTAMEALQHPFFSGCCSSSNGGASVLPDYHSEVVVLPMEMSNMTLNTDRQMGLSIAPPSFKDVLIGKSKTRGA